MPKHLPKSIPPVPQQPTVVKYVQPSRIGIQSHTLTRHCIGYVRRGTKYIYYGDVRHAVGAGEVFYLSAGTHYTEDVPTGSRNFEQVVFYYTSEQLARILNNLSLTYQLAITNDHSCPECEKQSHVVAPGWPALKNVFSTINAGLRDNLFADDDTAVHLKLHARPISEIDLLVEISSRRECISRWRMNHLCGGSKKCLRNSFLNEVRLRLHLAASSSIEISVKMLLCTICSKFSLVRSMLLRILLLRQHSPCDRIR